MPASEAQKRATKKWRAEKIHRVALDLTLSDYEKVKTAAEAAGVPVGTFCRSAVWAAIGSENPQDDQDKKTE